MTATAVLETRVEAVETERLGRLAAAARAGDRAALGALLEAIERRVYTLAYRLVRRSDAAQDVTQEALLRVCRHLGRYRGEASFWSWIYRIVVNQANDYWRSSARREVELEDGLAGPGFQPGREEQLRHVREAMKSLSEKERTALVLMDVEGFSSAEAARILGCLSITARTRAAYARKKLRRLLSRYYPELREEA